MGLILCLLVNCYQTLLTSCIVHFVSVLYSNLPTMSRKTYIKSRQPGLQYDNNFQTPLGSPRSDLSIYMLNGLDTILIMNMRENNAIWKQHRA